MKLLTVKNLSDLLSIKRSTLYLWVEKGEIPHYRVGRLVRFNLEEVDKWLRRHKKDSQAAEKAPGMSFKAPYGNSLDPLDIGRKAVDEVLGSGYNPSQRGNQTIKPGKEGN